MSAYWWGLATIPAACLVFAAVMWVARALILTTKPIAVAIARVTSATDERKRAMLGAVMYAATRCWLLSVGHLGFAFISGQGGRDRGDAFNRLYAPPKVSLRRLKRSTDRDAP